MGITIKKIAELAGVSRGTVDRALNHRGRVDPEVAKRVRQLAADYGYKPNRIAVGLKRIEHPLRIGIVINSVGNAFYEHILKGMDRARSEFADFGVEFFMIQLKGYNPEKQLEAIEEMTNQRVDAMVLTPIDHPSIIKAVNRCAEAQVQVVFLHADIAAKRLAYVGSDYFRSGQTAAGLINLVNNRQKRKVAILTGSFHMASHNQRIKGFQDVLNPALEVVAIEETEDDDLRAYETTKQLIDRQAPDIIYLTAGGALGTARAIGESGLDIQLYTMDVTKGIRELMMQDQIVATITQQPIEQGYQAIKLICDHMIGKCEISDYYAKSGIEMKYNIDTQ